MHVPVHSLQRLQDKAHLLAGICEIFVMGSIFSGHPMLTWTQYRTHRLITFIHLKGQWNNSASYGSYHKHVFVVEVTWGRKSNWCQKKSMSFSCNEPPPSPGIHLYVASNFDPNCNCWNGYQEAAALQARRGHGSALEYLLCVQMVSGWSTSIFSQTKKGSSSTQIFHQNKSTPCPHPWKCIQASI